MADDGSDGRLPRDIFAFIQALQRREHSAWMTAMSVVYGLTLKHYGQHPVLAMSADDFVQEVMVELLKPSTLTSFHGLGVEPPRRSSRPRITQGSATAALDSAGDHPGVAPDAAAVDLRWRFLAFLRTIMARVRSRRLEQAMNALGVTRTNPPAPDSQSIPASNSDSSDSRPTLVMPLGPDTLISQPGVDLPIPDTVVVCERHDLLCARLGEIMLRGEPWTTRVEWLLRAAVGGESYKQIARANGVDSAHVRDRLNELRDILRQDRKRYDAGNLPDDLFPPNAGHSAPAMGLHPTASPFYDSGRELIERQLVSGEKAQQIQRQRATQRDDERDGQSDKRQGGSR